MPCQNGQPGLPAVADHIQRNESPQIFEDFLIGLSVDRRQSAVGFLTRLKRPMS